jgi:hypothetical protein
MLNFRFKPVLRVKESELQILRVCIYIYMVCCLEEERLVLMFDFTSKDHTIHQANIYCLLFGAKSYG